MLWINQLLTLLHHLGQFLLLSRKPRDSFNIFDKIRYILVKYALLVILLDLGGVHDPQKSDLPPKVFPFPLGPLHRVDHVPLILWHHYLKYARWKKQIKPGLIDPFKPGLI